jgi:site-specific DNA-methyltransferase (adenine-specific)
LLGAALSAAREDVLLLQGDCLTQLAGWSAEARADLVYLDPPFNTSKDFGMFRDVWSWDAAAGRELSSLAELGHRGRRAAALLEGLHRVFGPCSLLAYSVFLARRLWVLVERVLSPAGSLVLHCDPATSHSSKLLLDALLGPECFLNEIVWHYRRWPVRSRCLQRMHDVLLFYRGSAAHDAQRPFTQLLGERTLSTQRRWGTARIRAHHDARGQRLPSHAEPETSPGVPLADVWDLPILAPSARERVGFPTQKPLHLLVRLVEITTRPGDLVVDPFCGSGTTLVAAQQLGRRAVGVDLSAEALDLARQRLAAREELPPAAAGASS